MAFTTHLIGRFIGLGKPPSENGGMRVDLGFRVGTSSRRVTRFSLPSKPGVGPRYILIPRDHRVLCVEDMLHRQLVFLRQLGSAARIVNSVEAAIAALQCGVFQWIMLDRDLIQPDKPGEEVAKFLAATRYKGNVICHSQNPTGAEFIRKILVDAGVAVELIPFELLGLIRER